MHDKNTHTKTIAAGLALLMLGLAGGWAASRWMAHEAVALPAATATQADRPVLFWYDPMVPTQKFDKPGKSPFMDMQLVPRYADEAGAGAAGAPPGVSVSPQAQQSLGLRVATAQKRRFTTTVDAVGTVMLNERDVAIVQARAAGFVEKVFARAPGDVIAAGAPLAELLHPEWLAAQQEYLAVRATGDALLSRAARQRLVLLGMPAAVVEQVDRSGQPQPLNTITAPVAGLISELMVRQGMTVSTGMTLARINGLGTVWVEAAVPEAQSAAVQRGQRAEVRLNALPGTALAGTVSAVLPEANRDSRTLRVRVELPNPGLRLRPGQFAQVALQGAATAEVVVVPAEAVIRTGRRALVYLLDAPGRYRPVDVQLGAEQDGFVAITRGVEAGQQVVVSGQFLIDSEASLQGLTAQAAAAPSAAAAPAASAPAGSTSAASTPAPNPSTPSAEHAGTGTVTAIDAGTITLAHGPVPTLKWPAMTMAFQLAQPTLAKGLKPGDAVQFSFKQQGDEHVVTDIRRAGGKP